MGFATLVRARLATLGHGQKDLSQAAATSGQRQAELAVTKHEMFKLANPHHAVDHERGEVVAILSLLNEPCVRRRRFDAFLADGLETLPFVGF